MPQQRLREGYGVRGCHRRRLWSKTGDMAFTLRCLVTNHPKPAGPTSTSTRSNLPHQPTNLQIRARLPRSSRPTTERRMAGSPSRPHHTSTMLWIRRGAPLPGSQSYATATPHLPTRVAPNTAEGRRRCAARKQHAAAARAWICAANRRRTPRRHPTARSSHRRTPRHLRSASSPTRLDLLPQPANHERAPPPPSAGRALSTGFLRRRRGERRAGEVGGGGG